MVKKVGVITMHRPLNYGSALQAYATKRIVESFGFQCEIIDYIYPNAYQYDRGRKHIEPTIKSKVAKFFGLKRRHRKRNRLDAFLKKFCNLSHRYKDHDAIMNNPPVYDIYLTGSDQVWNPLHMYGDEVFFLQFAPTQSHKIAFSSSFALKTIPEEYIDRYKSWLCEYKAISVREKNGQEIVKSLIGKDVPVTLDPTLLLSSEDWLQFSKRKHNPFQGKKYILLYVMGYAFDPTPYIYRVADYLSSQTGYDVYSLSEVPKDIMRAKTHIVSDVSPIGFLHLFESASYVVTSSFHGTAFAVNFGIPLCSIVDNDKGNMDDRQRTLLGMLGLQNCIVEKETGMEIINPIYNIRTKEVALEKMRQTSLDYLSQSLE